MSVLKLTANASRQIGKLLREGLCEDQTDSN